MASSEIGSSPKKNHKRLKTSLWAATLLIAGPIYSASDSNAQIISRYGPNFATGQFNVAQPRFSSDTQQLVDEIKLLIEEAERAGAADPIFLQDLRSTSDRFFWPWRNVVLFDDFADGDFEFNPQWLNPGGFVSVADNGLLVLDGTSADHLSAIKSCATPSAIKRG